MAVFLDSFLDFALFRLWNAAGFFAFYDNELAIDFLQKAQTLEPENPKWPRGVTAPRKSF